MHGPLAVQEVEVADHAPDATADHRHDVTRTRARCAVGTSRTRRAAGRGRRRRTGPQSAVTSVTWPSSTCQRRVRRTVSSMRRSCVTSRIVPVERVERRLQLLDRRQVQVVGRLVEDQQVHAAGLQERERGAGPLAGRLRRRRPVDVVAAEPELGQQRADVGGGPVGDLARERVDQRLVALERAPAPGRPRRRARRSRGRPRRTSAAADRAAAPSSVDLPDAVGAGHGDAVAASRAAGRPGRA